MLCLSQWSWTLIEAHVNRVCFLSIGHTRGGLRALFVKIGVIKCSPDHSNKATFSLLYNNSLYNGATDYIDGFLVQSLYWESKGWRWRVAWKLSCYIHEHIFEHAFRILCSHWTVATQRMFDEVWCKVVQISWISLQAFFFLFFTALFWYIKFLFQDQFWRGWYFLEKV